VIDEAGAAQRILPKSKQKKTIGKTEIEDIIAKIARIPPQTVNQDDRSKLQTSTATCATWCSARTRRSKRWRRPSRWRVPAWARPDKPIGSFLFSGPTGVGKTEVAKQLAFILASS
jgi:ATP-dependent Clp protease ATP-binding subunit ClpA